MRCYICNAIDAEHFDKRDNTYLCDVCKSEVDQLIYEQEEDDGLEDAPDLSEL